VRRCIKKGKGRKKGWVSGTKGLELRKKQEGDEKKAIPGATESIKLLQVRGGAHSKNICEGGSALNEKTILHQQRRESERGVQSSRVWVIAKGGGEEKPRKEKKE